MAIAKDTAFGEKVAQTKAAPTPAKDTAFSEKVAQTTASPAPTVAGINSFIATLQQKLSDQYVSQGLNPDGSKKVVTTTQRMQEERAAAAGLTVAQASTDPMFNKAVQPAAPAGFKYTWIGGTNTGKWTLYPVTTSTPKSGAGTGGAGTGGTGDTGGTDSTVTGTPSTNVEVLKALLKAQGFSSTIVDSSATYLTSLLKDNIDYDNAVEIFLNTKDYTLKNGTKVTSPFYTAYGYLNEGLTVPKKASELFNAVEGYKSLKDKYGFSDKYLSTDSLKNYVKNNVTVADLDERANAARLAALTEDAAKTDAFIKLGYIASKEGLQDFYMDAKVGKEQLELNRNTGAFVAEAIRRAGSSINVENLQIANYKKIAASLSEKGYTETQIANLAATGFQNISENLKPMVALSGIYEGTQGNAATTGLIESELQQEEFMNMASARRKKLEQQNIKAFQGSAGTTTGSLKTVNTGGLL